MEYCVDFGFNPISANDSAITRNVAHFKSGQNWRKKVNQFEPGNL